ncbi:extracellular solute-binding protein [Actinocrinis puniceicyclus]|uniref:Extracellular solute-binding protein n=1 Tax=Actinocrinis puniceicyclus TaxID=977794 RepID=A0A8J7WSB2_9ACTN|nr:extracellular solute-binding protein [Actinocrinis puniceicyclus]MBS2964725.1 extracellular solute-binding protein [Actinocrinis puniceicyclus]
MISWKRRDAGVGAAVLLLAVAATACGNSAGGTTTAGAAGSSGTASAPAAVAPLVVYSAQGYDAPVTKAFTAATGIPVKLDDDSTGPLLTKVSAERNNPQWDVLWVDGDTAFAALDKQGQLLDYTPPVTLTPAGQALVPADHAYIPVSTTVVPALIYNAAKAAGAAPTTWQDLAGAAYKGKVGMNDPSQSGPTYPLIAGLMNQLGGQNGGVKAGESFLTRLKGNGLHVFPTNGDTLHALETGQIDYGIIQSSAALGEVAKAPKNANFDPKIVYLPQSTLLPGVIGIDKGAPANLQAEAEKFVQYVLSPAGQAAMQSGDPSGDSLYWPVVPGVSPRAGMPPLPAQYQRLDPYFWGPLENQINTFFDTDIK